jgi:hypothetical protein
MFGRLPAGDSVRSRPLVVAPAARRRGGESGMTQIRTLKQLRRSHWRGLERLLKQAYREGYEAGLARARGQSRRGRPIRADATVSGLIRQIEDHFGLDRFGFEVRVVHAASGRRVPGGDELRRHLAHG